MCDSDHLDFVANQTIHDRKWEASEQHAACSVQVQRRSLGRLGNGADRPLEPHQERGRTCRAALQIPPIRVLGVFDSRRIEPDVSRCH